MFKAAISKALRRKRIGILMGGPSSEREISLKSGWAVYRALKEQNLNVVPLEINSASAEEIRQANISLAFIALHGKFGEDGTIQSILESLNIGYTGSGVTASYLCLDKVASRNIFKHFNIPVPEFHVLQRKLWPTRLKQLPLCFPAVVKPSNQGSSIGITFVDNEDKLHQAIDFAFHYDNTVIIENYIRGREITVGILQDKPLPVVEIVPKRRFFDFQAKYEKGKSNYIVPAQIPLKDYKRAQKIALLACRVLGCRSFSRVDMILSHGCPFVLEVNSIPGLTATSLLPMAAQAKGINFAQLCLQIVQSALKG